MNSPTPGIFRRETLCGMSPQTLANRPKAHSPVWALTLLGGIVLISVSCDPAKAPQTTAAAPAPPAVTVSRPVQREVRDWDEYAGHLQSPETANIQARVSGFIEEAPFHEGALVKKGDVLYVIDARPFKADLDNKKAAVAKDNAQLTLADADLKRSDSLLKSKAVSQGDYDTANARYQQAQAQLAADQAGVQVAELNLEWTKVTAPISGRVSRMYVTIGNLVNGGAGQATLLTTVVSVDPMYCVVPVPERIFLKYQAITAEDSKMNIRDAKIPCFIQLENETNFPHKGVIDFIDNNVDTNTGTIQLRGVIPNGDGMLTPGVFARMRITHSKPYQTLLIPDMAVGTEQNERYILIVGKDDIVESRPVKLGRTFGNLRSITEGLKPDDRVVVNGMQQARPGAKVAPKEIAVSLDSLSAFDIALSADKLTNTVPHGEASK